MGAPAAPLDSLGTLKESGKVLGLNPARTATEGPRGHSLPKRTLSSRCYVPATQRSTVLVPPLTREPSCRDCVAGLRRAQPVLPKQQLCGDALHAPVSTRGSVVPVSSQNRVPTPTTRCATFSSPRKETPSPTTPHCPSSSPWQTVTHFLPLWTGPCWAFHGNGIGLGIVFSRL